ncbi:hypothetical protein [Curtobacterium sp. MCPF17_051]|uniref:hypothetical protein n=1 Tax=Curtobacterium sp. MCPF17_051 TaxID=2175640 RepID=UPI000DAA5E22|nr:hypothetical protein [Curtobacterium sp. MCPF17_051]PZF32064.1 hypothetical protein DEJ35_05435 [Curtobacterium sp. MCPF17_051]
MTEVGAASFRVVARNGEAVDLAWVTSVVIPSGVTVECVDLGWRTDIVLTSRHQEVTVIGDLRTSERVLLGPEESPLVDLALLLMEQRLRVPWTGRLHLEGDPSPLRLLARSTGARWLPPLEPK